MRIPQILLTIMYFVLGSTLAFADDSRIVTAAEKDSESKVEKMEILEFKIKALESRIDRYLPKSSSEIELVGNPYGPELVKKMVGWSSKDHLAEAKAQHQTVETLDAKIRALQERIDRYNQKRYLDTKGFKRESLRHIKGNLVQDLREATVKTAWHKTQAEKVMLSESTQYTRKQSS